MAGIALLLAIDLLFLPWFSFSVLSISVSFTATGSPDGWLGVLALLCTIALVADLAIARLSPQTQLRAFGGSRENTRFVLAAAAAGLRVTTDTGNAKIGYKVREHSLAKIPAMLVVGRREAERGTVSLRRLGGDEQEALALAEALARLQAEGAVPRPP